MVKFVAINGMNNVDWKESIFDAKFYWYDRGEIDAHVAIHDDLEYVDQLVEGLTHANANKINQSLLSIDNNSYCYDLVIPECMYEHFQKLGKGDDEFIKGYDPEFLGGVKFMEDKEMTQLSGVSTQK